MSQASSSKAIPLFAVQPSLFDCAPKAKCTSKPVQETPAESGEATPLEERKAPRAKAPVFDATPEPFFAIAADHLVKKGVTAV